MQYTIGNTVINSIKYKCTFNNSIAERLIIFALSKQLEYITKDHILAGITVLNNIIMLITQSLLYVARATLLFNASICIMPHPSLQLKHSVYYC